MEDLGIDLGHWKVGFTSKGGKNLIHMDLETNPKDLKELYITAGQKDEEFWAFMRVRFSRFLICLHGFKSVKSLVNWFESFFPQLSCVHLVTIGNLVSSIFRMWPSFLLTKMWSTRTSWRSWIPFWPPARQFQQKTIKLLHQRISCCAGGGPLTEGWERGSVQRGAACLLHLAVMSWLVMRMPKLLIEKKKRSEIRKGRSGGR